ncbi:MAG: hypothetical protein FJX54_13365 [Alphaproteobacteria bacterium]|nr:hypothetical protein [Alphaproteobacteria bacterium]
MRALILVVLVAPLALTACSGGEQQRVYVQPSTASVPGGGTTVVVPPGSSAKICPVGTVC